MKKPNETKRVPPKLFWKSARQAEFLVRMENNLQKLRDGDAPEDLIGSQEKLVAQARKFVEMSAIAKEILPQARAITPIMAARHDEFEMLLVSKLQMAINLHLAKLKGHLEHEDSEPFYGAQENHLWQAMLRGLEKGSTAATFEALAGLIDLAKSELLNVALPPLPPPYTYKGQIYAYGSDD